MAEKEFWDPNTRSWSTKNQAAATKAKADAAVATEKLQDVTGLAARAAALKKAKAQKAALPMKPEKKQ